MNFRILISMMTLFVFGNSLAEGNKQTTNGYAYTLYSTSPDVEALGQFPPEYDEPKVEYVMQGDQHTLIWQDRISERTVDKASLALGERHMGLLIPFWPPAKSISDATGWTDYGDKVTYSDFNVDVERGDGERALAGGMAQHYVLTADYTRHVETERYSTREKMQMDFWVLSDKPFSFAPFRTPGAYADPRFGATLFKKLTELGLVVRSDARYSSVAVDDDGEEVGTTYDGTWTTWITDLEPAEVPVLDMPIGDHETLRVLQDAFRKQPEETCDAVISGVTPNFIEQNLNSHQQTAVLDDLRLSCKKQRIRTLTRSMKKNPQPVCEKIKAGQVPEVVSRTLNEDEQKSFMQNATTFCQNQAQK